MKTLPISLALLLIFCFPVHADDDLNYHLVNLQADASQQVDNNLQIVLLTAAAENAAAQEAAASVNKAMTRAVTMIKENDDVTYQTLNYQTTPLYKNRAIIGWQVSQQIRLESQNIEGLTTLVGRLQEVLTVASMHFTASPERRKETQTLLIGEALTAFTAKARLVATTLGAQDFRLVNLTINEGGGMPIRHAYAMEMDALRAAAPAPEVAAGESSITVSVNGTIQLIF
ncbi:SIMPL domain-containing protein [Desulfofustis limnaeus]|uniref:DUF541 domain-containing protein n=1 Tax=Desulfofustis limnaeus TaxID=2740163 RepID=A0ABM7WEA3_9BACT|nr:SIMPL domain-containing protein [Desulfofustis limnaeus]BDD89333.1 hypothetical protein DPPLL_36980 [Desulfofustis limnaeus]